MQFARLQRGRRRTRSRVTPALVAALLPALLSAQDTKVNVFGNPERMIAAPTRGVIDVRDLQSRLYVFADDSMLGRQIGRIGNMKGTAYIAAEVQRLGLLPGGHNGTYFQTLPYHLRKFTEHSRLTVDGNPLEWGTDWVAVPGTRAPRGVVNADVVFGGTVGDTTARLGAAQAAGKLVVMLPAPRDPVARGPRPSFAGVSPYPDAAAIALIDLDDLTPAQRAAINEPTVATSAAPPRAGGGGGRGGAANAPVDSLALLKAQLAQLAPQASLRLTRAAAARLFKGTTLDGIAPGAKGGVVNASLEFVELPTEWARNVIAIIPGSDPKLRHQYVAVGAHNDHVGLTLPADKDSVRAFNVAANRLLLANKMIALSPELRSSIRVNMDSIRRIHPTPRRDSIRNGADDDGSGSMGVLEIAEAMMAMPVKPKRSTIFIWHTGEEAGLIGSAFFTANPTVPMDSVVAQLNIDMIGRGRAEDLPGGGPDYLGVVGSFFDSKDLGDQVAAANRKLGRPLKLDYRYDSTMTWSSYNNIYGRSDHYNYARQGVPIAFFFTGLHGDYHQISDEAEFIDYPHYARITNYIRDVVLDVANGPRPRLNGSKPSKPRAIVP
jgi:hypothetical protein